MGTESSVIGVDDTEWLRCGVCIPVGDSGGDDIVISCSCWSDGDEWTSSVLG